MGAKNQGIAQSKNRYHVVPRTLIFITNGDDVLLLKGAQDKRIWPNRYNGVGGHVEHNETVRHAAQRELKEEVGLEEVGNLRLCGMVNISTDDPALGIMLFVFIATSPTREIRPSTEGTPHWISRNQLPLDLLVEDLPILLPRVLDMSYDDPPFFARYWYDEQDNLQMIFDVL